MRDLDALADRWVALFDELGVSPEDEVEAEELVALVFVRNAGLPLLGAGNTRVVFDLGDGTVLKLPIAGGHAANIAECARWQAFSDRNAGRWLAPVIACDPAGRWLVQTKVDRISRKALQPLFDDSRVAHELSALGIEDFRGAMQWGLLDGEPVLIDYGTVHDDPGSVQAMKTRLLAR